MPDEVRGGGGSPAVAEMQARVPRRVRGHVAGRAFHVSSVPVPRGSGGHSSGGGRKAFPLPNSAPAQQPQQQFLQPGTRAVEYGRGEAGDWAEAFVGGGERNGGAEPEVDDVVQEVVG